MEEQNERKLRLRGSFGRELESVEIENVYGPIFTSFISQLGEQNQKKENTNMLYVCENKTEELRKIQVVVIGGS